MRRLLLLLALLAPSLLPGPAWADEDVVAGISQDQIEINSSYTGTQILVYGAIERPSASGERDIIVVVRGPDTDITVRRRDRVAGIWMNRDAAKFEGLPAFYFLASTRPLAKIADAATLERYGLGAAHVTPDKITSHHDAAPFRTAAIRQLTAQGLYREIPGGIDFDSESLFKTHVPIPASVMRGQYSVEVYLLRDGQVVSAQSTPFFIDQTGLERRLSGLARSNGLGYGLAAVAMALLLGWCASVLLRRPGA